ncbi:ATP-binding protein [Cupriavidus basilensis]
MAIAFVSACATPGAGLAPERLAQLFQPFNRLEHEGGPWRARASALVVAKRLVELMGGAIGADSTPGAGSVFWSNCRLRASRNDR